MSSKLWREENIDKMRMYRRKWYKTHKQKAKKAIYLRRKSIETWYKNYKKTLKCSRCSESHPACLDFHHRDMLEKDDAVSQMVVYRGCSKKRILAEIAKCDVICSNCHRKLHWKDS